MSGGLDVEAEECTEEVQKEQERAVDWTLKRRNARRKSKRNEAAGWIGRRSRGMHRGSPKEENMYMETAARQASVPTD